MRKAIFAGAIALATFLLVSASARAQAEPEGQATPANTDPEQGAPGAPPALYGPPPIPPGVEADPQPVGGGGYCYVGAHPADTRVAAGPPWDDNPGQHVHTYPPFDTRLFAFRDGCYYFIGDPTDFGYRGNTYQYWGAHPVIDHYGGGWCFMIGGHVHLWQPWSPFFVSYGPWHYWHGAYDGIFWSYWPYWSFYYRSHYPAYYGGGRFARGRDVHVAPPIRSVPAPPTQHAGAWAGGSAWGNSPGFRGGATAAPGTPQPAMPQAIPRQHDGFGPRDESGRSANPWGRSFPGGSYDGGRSYPPSYRSAPSYSAPMHSAPSFRGGGGGGGGFRRH